MRAIGKQDTYTCSLYLQLILASYTCKTLIAQNIRESDAVAQPEPRWRPLGRRSRWLAKAKTRSINAAASPLLRCARRCNAIAVFAAFAAFAALAAIAPFVACAAFAAFAATR